MVKKIKKIVWFFILLIFPVTLFAQNDVTHFLDITVDGYKPEMIQKLKSKGFTPTRYVEDILEGEFNGRAVNIFIATNNNKVWRIAVADAYTTDETDIKIRFNNLIQQFSNNKRYLPQTDSVITKLIIPQEEDISYEIAVNKKQYEAAFTQKPVNYDSLMNERDLLLKKDTLDNKERERSVDLSIEYIKMLMNSLNKTVWFMIKEDQGEYKIIIYYDNEYNKANGEDL